MKKTLPKTSKPVKKVNPYERIFASLLQDAIVCKINSRQRGLVKYPGHSNIPSKCD